MYWPWFIYDFDDATMSRIILSMSKRNSYTWGGIRTVNIVQQMQSKQLYESNDDKKMKKYVR